MRGDLRRVGVYYFDFLYWIWLMHYCWLNYLLFTSFFWRLQSRWTRACVLLNLLIHNLHQLSVSVHRVERGLLILSGSILWWSFIMFYGWYQLVAALQSQILHTFLLKKSVAVLLIVSCVANLVLFLSVQLGWNHITCYLILWHKLFELILKLFINVRIRMLLECYCYFQEVH